MTRTTVSRSGLAAVLSLVIAGLACSGLVAQESRPTKPDPEVKAKLKKFKEATEDRKKGRDAEATDLIDHFLQGFEGLHPKDQDDVRKAIGKCLTSNRVKRPPEKRGLFTAASVALGRMGPKGSRDLVSAYDRKFNGREWVTMRAVILKSIGQTKDPKQISFLTKKVSRDTDDKILQAAGEALGHFEDAKLPVRKDIAKEVIKRFNEIDGQSRASLDPGDPNVKRAKERLAAVRDAWNTTLRKLTGQPISAPAEWQRFYNKNKGKNWDKMKS